MFETMTKFVINDHMSGLTYDPPLDNGGYTRHLSPDRRPYKTKDGYICAIIYNNKHWEIAESRHGRENDGMLDRKKIYQSLVRPHRMSPTNGQRRRRRRRAGSRR